MEQNNQANNVIDINAYRKGREVVALHSKVGERLLLSIPGQDISQHYILKDIRYCNGTKVYALIGLESDPELTYLVSLEPIPEGYRTEFLVDEEFIAVAEIMGYEVIADDND